MTGWRGLITPNGSRKSFGVIVAGLVAVWLVGWAVFKPVVLPSPLDVAAKLLTLQEDINIGPEMVNSLVVNWEALALAVAVSLPLAYLSRVPLAYPIAQGAALLRALSPALFYLPLLFLVGSGHAIKVIMLAMGESFFLIQSMVDIVQSVPEKDFDQYRTLRMSEWQTTWYAVVRGTLNQAIRAIRANAMMGWPALMMVEIVVASEGGIGYQMHLEEKHMEFATLYAAAFVILGYGLLQDYLLGVLEAVTCPWA